MRPDGVRRTGIGPGARGGSREVSSWDQAAAGLEPDRESPECVQLRQDDVGDAQIRSARARIV